MATLYISDLSQSTILAFNSVTGATTEVPISLFPPVLALFAARREGEIVYSKYQPFNQNNPDFAAHDGRRVMVGTPPGLPDTTVTTISLPEVYGKDPHFWEKVRTGEMVVTNRQTGSVSIISQPGFAHSSVLDYGPREPTMYRSAQNFYSYGDLKAGKVWSTDGRYRLSQAISFIKLKWYGYVVSGPAFAAPSVDFSIADVVHEPDTALVTEAYARAQSGYWDVLTELVELPETLRFLRKSAMQILVITEDYQRREPKLGKLWNAGEKLANHWLAWRYAIMPIVYTLMDAQQVFGKIDRAYSRYKTSGGSAFPFPPVPEYSLVNDTEIVDSVFIKNKYDGASLASKLYSMLDMNPFVTAVEATRLSFVLDWVINLSDFVKASTATTTSTSQVATWSSKASGVATYKSLLTDASVSYSMDTYSRRVILPSDYVGLALDVGYTWKRQLDTIALSFSAVSKYARSLR